ncbi:hypothetical protein FRX31_006445 [Thalictrum thalictroides]|uniref:Uncharacterized protein n=1 Tax=Thalictrum thalictroides TaxID=46969 RepID=A0A7J6X2I5_THATH|nr:hypothetical protein FRX31_006445 [Thalictrum thalictroides]
MTSLFHILQKSASFDWKEIYGLGTETRFQLIQLKSSQIILNTIKDWIIRIIGSLVPRHLGGFVMFNAFSLYADHSFMGTCNEESKSWMHKCCLEIEEEVITTTPRIYGSCFRRGKVAPYFNL